MPPAAPASAASTVASGTNVSSTTPSTAATSTPSAATPASSSSASSPTVVSSASSRSNYADNVSTLTSANKSLGPQVQNVAVVGSNGKTTYYSGVAAGLAAYQSSMGAAPTSSATAPPPSSSNNNTGGGSNNNSGGTSTAPINNGSNSGAATDTSAAAGAAGSPASGATANGGAAGGAAGGAGAAANGGAGATRGTSTTGQATAGKDANGNAVGATGYDGNTDPGSVFYNTGISPALQTEYQSSLDSQDQAVSSAQATLASATSTYSEDQAGTNPAAIAAATAIQQQYAVLIQAMQAKNAQLIGRANSAVGAFGGLGVMDQSFMSDEMDLASQRLASIVAEEQSAIIKSNQAYESGDLKAFNDATTELKDAKDDKVTTLNKLLTAANDQVKNVQAQAKIDAANTKTKQANDIAASTKGAPGMVTALQNAGVKSLDDPSVANYIQAYATAYGISDIGILTGALSTAWQTAEKTNSTIAHTNAETIKTQTTSGAGTTKVKGGTDAGYTYTADDVTAAKNILQQGGNGYAAAGSDGYSDPGAYTSLMNSWVSLGGTVAGFAKVFPPKTYVNPTSYGLLPAAIQPKKSAATTSAYTT